MLFDVTRCMGVAPAWGVPGGERAPREPRRRRAYDVPLDLDGKTQDVIKLAVLHDRRAFLKMQCMQSVDPACVSVCMIGALHKERRASSGTTSDRCVGCRY